MTNPTIPARLRSPSPPRELPAAEPQHMNSATLMEEETFPWYNSDKWFPVRVGEIFESRYQVLLKLGYGSVSTAWLCRDLREHKYVTIKEYQTGHRQSLNECKVLAHLGSVTSDHPGAEHVRLALGSFELPGETGPEPGIKCECNPYNCLWPEGQCTYPCGSSCRSGYARR